MPNRWVDRAQNKHEQPSEIPCVICGRKYAHTTTVVICSPCYNHCDDGYIKPAGGIRALARDQKAQAQMIAEVRAKLGIQSLADDEGESWELGIELGLTDDTTRFSELADLAHLEVAQLQDIEERLIAKKQLIFQGPPGSGKTFIGELFGRYLSDNPLTGAVNGCFEIVQFHQSYSYEDFIEGIRPDTDGSGALAYHLRPGIFKTF